MLRRPEAENMKLTNSRRPFAHACVALSLAFACQATAAVSARWPQFRGPNSAGVADSEKPPVHFGGQSNVLWRADMPPGLSSPCIWDDRIFLTTFSDNKLATLCLDRTSGRTLWTRTAPAEKIESYHPTESSPATATPATDGKRVVVYFGSCGLLAYDFDGTELWRLTLPTVRQVGDFGSGTSPLLVDGTVIVSRDQLNGSELLAVDAETGREKWKADRSEFKSSFGTPIIWRHSDTQEVVLPGSLQMVAYNLQDGAERWRVHGLPSAMCTTPVVNKDVLFFAGWAAGKSDAPIPKFSSFLEKEDTNHDGAISAAEAKSPLMKMMFGTLDANRDQRVTQEEWDTFTAGVAKGENVALALRPGGRGNITESHVLWKYKRGLPYVASPLVYRDSFYFVRDGGMITCLSTTTGEPRYEQERLGAAGSYYSSPIAANGFIYLCSVNGTVTVIQAGEKFEVVAKNELKQRIAATPAVADNTLYLRTDKQLYAFKSKG